MKLKESELSINDALKYAYSRGFQDGRESVLNPKDKAGIKVSFGFSRGQDWGSLTARELDSYMGYWNNPARDSHPNIEQYRKEINTELTRRLNNPNTQRDR